MIGGKFLKKYLHGYVMHKKLYNKLKNVANPFEYEQFHKEKVK